jgi:hypothetical protein
MSHTRLVLIRSDSSVGWNALAGRPSSVPCSLSSFDTTYGSWQYLRVMQLAAWRILEGSVDM